MRVAFRADGGRSIGSGHLMRCLALAQALRERAVEVDFICAAHAGFAQELITDAGFPLHRLPVAEEGEDAKLSADICLAIKPDWLVLDHYGLGQKWEHELHRVVPRIMVIEDVADRVHEADLLLDQNLREDADIRYRQLIPDSCIRLFGPQYALLRPQFAEARGRCGVRNATFPHILLFMGGGDARNVTLGMLKIMGDCRLPFTLEAIVGGGHPAPESVEKFCLAHGWAFHRQVDDMAERMAGADLAIGAGGVASWERCAVGLPALLVVLSDNQEENAAMLHQRGAAISLGWWESLVPADVCQVLGELNGDRLAAMSQSSFDITDGQGAGRVAEVMLTA